MVEESKEKVSAAAMSLLWKNKYAYIDDRKKIMVFELSKLSKNETLNSVAKWSGASQPVIAQIQELLKLHNKRPLQWVKQEAKTDKDVHVKELLDQYGNRITEGV